MSESEIQEDAKNATHRTMTNSIWVIAQSFLLNILSIFVVGYIARKLGAADYGIFIFASAFVMMFLPIVNLGLRAITVRKIAENKQDANIIIGKILTLRMFLSIIAMAAVIIVVNLMKYPALTKIIVYITSLTIICRALSTSFQDVFQAFERMKYIALAQFVSGILLTVLSLIAILMGYRLIGITWVYTIGAVIAVIISGYLLVRHFSTPVLKIDFKVWKQCIVEGAPFFLPGMVALFGAKIGIIFLSKFAGDVSMGAFGAAQTLFERLIVIPDGVGTAIFPAIAALNKKSVEAAKQLFKEFFLYLFMLGLPIAIGMCMLAKPVILLIYGEEYLSSVLVLQILGWCLFLKFINSIQGWTLGAIHKEKIAAKVPLISTPCYIMFNLLLIPPFKEVGAAIALMLSSTVVFFLFSYYMRIHFVETMIDNKVLLKVIAANICMAVSIYFLQQFNVLIAIAGAMIVYGFFIIQLHITTKEEIIKFFKTYLKKRKVKVVTNNVQP